MNKMLTGLTVWTLFLILMGVLFPIPTTTDTGYRKDPAEHYDLWIFLFNPDCFLRYYCITCIRLACPPD
ncbi:hypothetical protein ACE1TI_03105 [Alteribacillus sp. JSM 102045]|uniref:hypothetical protein n=1 Tax=Alteribacillus sp. JSM 102045 TaxID=1562101 RepID=UPI0035C02D90